MNLSRSYQEPAPERLVMRASVARALHNFDPAKIGKRRKGELPFRKGDLIQVISDKDEHWWKGQLNGASGLIPAKYIVGYLIF